MTGSCQYLPFFSFLNAGLSAKSPGYTNIPLSLLSAFQHGIFDATHGHGLGLFFVYAHSICPAFSFLFLMYICFFPAYYSSTSKAMRHATMYDDALYRAISWWKTSALALPLKIEHLHFVLTIWEL
jgi:hypothetical protein